MSPRAEAGLPRSGGARPDGVADTFRAPRQVDLLALGELAAEVRPETLEGSDLNLPGGHSSVALEEILGERRPWSSGDLKLLGRGAPRFSYRLRLPVAQRRLQRLLDDKVEARRLFSRLRLDAPRWTTVLSPAAEHHRIVERLGLPYVLQSPRGSGGTTTWIVTSRTDAAAISRSGSRLLASAWLEGPPVNVHIYVDEREAIVSAPSIQITGAAVGLTGSPYVYAGADFAGFANLPQSVSEAFLDGAVRLARHLHSLGWRGLLGIDAIAGEKEVSFLELNPRYQSSTWLLARGETELGLTPVGELEARRAESPPAPAGPLCVRMREPLRLATLIVRAREETRMDRRRLFATGRYVLDVNGGFELADRVFETAALDDRHILIEGMPLPAVRTLRRGAVLGRLTVRGQLIRRDGQLQPRAELLSRAMEAASAVRHGSSDVPSFAS